MTIRSLFPIGATIALAIGTLFAQTPQQQQPPPPTPPPQQPTEVSTTISSGEGTPPRFAVPDFIALSPDAETQTIAKTIGQVLWDDLNFSSFPATRMQPSLPLTASATCRSIAGAS
jgi:hypothetical protein